MTRAVAGARSVQILARAGQSLARALVIAGTSSLMMALAIVWTGIALVAFVGFSTLEAGRIVVSGVISRRGTMVKSLGVRRHE